MFCNHWRGNMDKMATFTQTREVKLALLWYVLQNNSPYNSYVSISREFWTCLTRSHESALNSRNSQVFFCDVWRMFPALAFTVWRQKILRAWLPDAVCSLLSPVWWVNTHNSNKLPPYYSIGVWCLQHVCVCVCVIGPVRRRVRHWPCDKGHEPQLASRLLLLWSLSGCSRRRGLCEERRQVSLR